MFALWRYGFKERAVYRTEAMHRAMILRSYHLLASSFQTWLAISKAVRFEQVNCNEIDTTSKILILIYARLIHILHFLPIAL